MALTVMGFSFDELKSGGLSEKHTVASWNLRTIAALAQREENQRRDGRTFRMRTGFWPAVRQMKENL
jgi:hypothetical protein